MSAPVLRIKCSFFKSAVDPWPEAWEDAWEALKCLLDLDWVPGWPLDTPDPKKSLPALSGASFHPNCRRGRANVAGIQVLLVDFDNAVEVPTGESHRTKEGRVTDRPIFRKECLPDPVSPAEVVDVLVEAGVVAYLYSTWSHSPAWPRFRLVVPLNHPIVPDLWPAASEWALDHLGIGKFRRGIDLPVLRDTARIHFLPAANQGDVQRWGVEGRVLSIPPGELVGMSVARTELSLWQRRILARRALDGRWERRYTFDLRTLDLASLLASRGIVVGPPLPYGGGLKWRCHCPWALEHTHALDDDSAVVIHEAGRLPVWRCAHSHHAHLGLRDILEWAEGPS